MTFELGWKVLRDFLQQEGFEELNSPRSVIKKAFETESIEEGHIWMELLEDRNLTTHAYDEEAANEVEQLVRTKYFGLLQNLYLSFKDKMK
jgi:nucleotidyltransferase substrate binding protein (TIGR01987 family)